MRFPSGGTASRHVVIHMTADRHMALTAGARVGPHEILSLEGIGGMGEVYKARDRRLARIVAIKFLRAEAAGQPDRRARFENEARAISSLSHPHICTLYDIGSDEGRPFLVMEYLEGETLDDRLTRGPLPAADVLKYAVQIADALAHAHRAHVVHRDLKPGNVMLTAAGAKILDFGLARYDTIDAGPLGTSTISFEGRTLTDEGTIVGTLQYMAPEQLHGKDTDARTDIFAFGSLLYEMATGRKAFDAVSQTALIASILTEQPPPIADMRAGGDLPPGLDHVIERCLAKNADERWQTARDLQRELEWIGGVGLALQPVSRGPRSWRRSWLLLTSLLVVLILAVAVLVALLLRNSSGAANQVTRFIVGPPPGSIIPFGEQRTRLAISPDGRTVAFVAFNEGHLQLWVQPLDSLMARPVPGTEGAVSPFWSPDSKYLGFFMPATGELKRVELSGGTAQTICSAAAEGVADWGADNTILFSIFRSGIFRVSGDGGTPTRVTSLDKAGREINHYWPTWLPDGEHFLYLATANASDTTKAVPSVYVASIDGTERTRLDRIHSRVMFASPAYLLFEDQGTLFAQQFDLEGRRLTGQPVAIADAIATTRTLGTAHFSVSNNVLAYLGSGDTFEMVWFDRRGSPTAPGWPKQWYGEPRLSPDGGRAVIDVYDPRSGTADLWIYDLLRNAPTRFTSESPTDKNAVWSPDGRGLLYSTEQGGSPNIFFRSFEGSGELEPIVVNPGPVFADDWSPDGQWIAYTATTAKSGQDLWLKPLSGDRKERVFLNTRFDEESARFSPDSRWLAFSSNETSSTPEIYVARVDEPGERVRISSGGGTGPRWRRDGKELFYAATDGRTIMAVPIESLTPFRAGVPARLFTLGIDSAVARTRARNTIFDVSGDGQRFLVSVPIGQPASSQIAVVLNWRALLRR